MRTNTEKKPYKKPSGAYYRYRRELANEGITINELKRTIYCPVNKLNRKLAIFADRHKLAIQLTIDES